jgi:pyruvate formate lyase activating enzyme
MSPAAPLIAEIKRNSLDDGPGIRTAVFFKGCPLSCVWCHNPECIAPRPELLWRKERCVRSRACGGFCPGGVVPPSGPKRVDRDAAQRGTLDVDECPSGALEIVGRRHALDELVELLCRDRSFYEHSGGGVTLTGGEATLFIEWVGELSRRLKQRGIHVLLETCGHFDWSKLEALLLPHLGAVYIDLKLVDPEAHQRHCGRDNRTILENLDRLLASGADVLVRIPLIPEITSTHEALASAAALLRQKGVRRVALLPYNPLWSSKSAALGRAARYGRDSWLTADETAQALELFADFDLLSPGGAQRSVPT